MGAPETNGQLRTSIQAMEIGDYIKAGFNTTVVNDISQIGTSAFGELPFALTSNGQAGTFYFIKVARGLLIADRCVQVLTTWDALNTRKHIEGKPWDSGNIIPDMTSNNAPSGAASASSIYSSSYEAWQAFSGGSAYPWNSTSGQTTGWIAYEFTSPVAVKKYSLKASFASSDLTCSPKSWVFEGSVDGVVWDVLDKRDNQSAWTVNEERAFTFNNSNQYRKYRVNVSLVQGGTWIIINRIKMFDMVGTIRSLSGGVSYADGSGNLLLVRPATDFGCFPSNNEYDTYIKKSSLEGKVTPDNDNVWHHKGIWNWVQETPVNGFNSAGSGASSGVRMVRGYDNYSAAQGNMTFATSGLSATNIGFRPVLEYREG